MHTYVQSLQVPRLFHSAHLSEVENRSVHELASRVLRQQETPIGIVLDGYPTWMWQIGTHGRVKWMVSKHNLPFCANDDPLWISRSSLLLSLEDVEVILVEGNWPAPNHPVWLLPSLRVAVCVTPFVLRISKRKKRRRETFAVSMPTG